MKKEIKRQIDKNLTKLLKGTDLERKIFSVNGSFIAIDEFNSNPNHFFSTWVNLKLNESDTVDLNKRIKEAIEISGGVYSQIV